MYPGSLSYPFISGGICDVRSVVLDFGCFLAKVTKPGILFPRKCWILDSLVLGVLRAIKYSAVVTRRSSRTGIATPKPAASLSSGESPESVVRVLGVCELLPTVADGGFEGVKAN